MASLDPFFVPHGVAVVGASRDAAKLGHVVLRSLIAGGYAGPVYAVNPEAAEVLGVPAYASVAHITGPVDLAVIVVPAAGVAQIIDDCGEKGVTAAVVISAGFREIGPRGAALESEMVEHARAAGVRIIGPNSVGIINTFANLNVTFAEAQPLRYDVAVCSQSGAVATAILDWARAIGVGFSKFISLGNAADVNEIGLLTYLADDPETRVIVLYLEGFRDGRRLVEVARTAAKRKPIVVMKVGRTAAGAHAAASHTGALAAPDAIVDAAFRQAGVVRAESMEELFDLTLAFAFAPLPRGPRVAVVTNAGGPGVMAVDAIARSGLEVASLKEPTVRALAARLPTAASLRNPVDVLGDARPERYKVAIEQVLADPGVDALVVLLTPQAMTDPEETAGTILACAQGQDKPVFAVYMGGDAVAPGRTMLDFAHIPAFHYPERAVRALAGMYAYHRFRSGD